MHGHKVVYSNHIEKIKRMLLVTIVLGLAVMGWYIWRYDPPRVKPQRIERVSDADVIIHDVELVEYMQEQPLWELQATEAAIYSTTKRTHLQNITADFFDTDGTRSMHIISDTGIKNDLSGDIWASGNVQADALVEGIHLKTDELAYDAETQLITSNAHVRMTKANIITEGFGLKSDLHLEKVIIIRDVETILSHPDPLSPPIVITADTLQLDHSAEIATYTGHVLVTQGTSEIRANLMRVHIQQLSSAENSIERIDVFGDVRITQDQMLATGDKGRYTSQLQTVVLTGTPEQQAHAEDAVSGRSLDADLIRVLLETNDFEGEGNVKFTGVPGL